MSGILKSATRMYEFSLENMKQLIAADLGVKASAITVEYVIGDIGPGYPMGWCEPPRGVVKIVVRVEDNPTNVAIRHTSSLAAQINAVETDLRQYGDK